MIAPQFRRNKKHFMLDLIYQLLLILSLMNYFFRFLKWVGVSKIKWLVFYLVISNKCQKVLIDGEYSMPRTIKTGARRGYVLCRVLFSCYSFPLEVLFERHDVNFRFYADDALYCDYYASINQGALILDLRPYKSG